MSSVSEAPVRGFGAALMRGLLCRCPACGEGKMFRAFLKVADECPSCRQPFHHHQADDAPAYFVIVIVGHIVVPLSLSLEMAFTPPFWLHAAIWLPLTTLLTVGLLQPIKGAIVAWQWTNKMHGFGSQADADHDAGRSLSLPRAEAKR